MMQTYRFGLAIAALLLLASSSHAFSQNQVTSGIRLSRQFSLYSSAPKLKPKFAWTKDPPKRSLDRPDIQQSHTAQQWILNLVQVAHWSLSLPLVWHSYVIVSQFESWLEFVDHNYFRMLLLILYPMVTLMSALFPIMSHSYDEWQLAPFRDFSQGNHLSELPVEPSYQASDYGNDRLHRQGYNMLFLFLGIGGLVLYHGLLGFDAPVLPVSLAFLVYGVLGDQNNLLSKYVPSPAKEPIVPVPVCTTVLFVYSQVLWLVVLGFLLSNVDAGSSFLKALAGVAVVGQTLGGVNEGVKAESTFSQWDHVISIGYMWVGFTAEAWFFLEYGRLLST